MRLTRTGRAISSDHGLRSRQPQRPTGPKDRCSDPRPAPAAFADSQTGSVHAVQETHAEDQHCGHRHEAEDEQEKTAKGRQNWHASLFGGQFIAYANIGFHTFKITGSGFERPHMPQRCPMLFPSLVLGMAGPECPPILATPSGAKFSQMPSFQYSGSRLDRGGVHRRDPDWVAAMMADPSARVLPVWRDRNLVHESNGDGAGMAVTLCELRALQAPQVTPLVAATFNWVFLGMDEVIGPVFAVDISTLDEERAAAVAGSGAFQDLRRISQSVSMDEAAIMAYARGMLTWHRRNLHCGVCGSPTESIQAGHVRHCTSGACGAEAYPRTDPAVIMLVERPASDGEPARCLLARHARVPRPVYSTLAGFVEPGESLEEAVAREVAEETGVIVDSWTYHGSQPWPFPASLMVGFRVRASTTVITLDPGELDEACWFTAAELDAFGEWGDESAQRSLPRPDSIARSLVESWRAEQRLPQGEVLADRQPELERLIRDPRG